MISRSIDQSRQKFFSLSVQNETRNNRFIFFRYKLSSQRKHNLPTARQSVSDLFGSSLCAIPDICSHWQNTLRQLLAATISIRIFCASIPDLAIVGGPIYFVVTCCSQRICKRCNDTQSGSRREKCPLSGCFLRSTRTRASFVPAHAVTSRRFCVTPRHVTT